MGEGQGHGDAQGAPRSGPGRTDDRRLGALRGHHVRALLPLAVRPAQLRAAGLGASGDPRAVPGRGGLLTARGSGREPGRRWHGRWLQHRGTGTGRGRGGTPTARGRPRRAAGACDTGDLWRTRGQVGKSPELRATGQLVEPATSSSRRACFGGHPRAARPRRLDRRRDWVAGLHRRPPEQR